jgi:hypothetical protein
MSQENSSPETISSEPEAGRKNLATQPSTMDSSASPDITESARHSDVTSMEDSPGGRQPSGQVEKPEEQPSATASPRRETSEKKKAANRLNSQKSTGPRTARGKANSRRNALTHGLLAQKALFTSTGMPQEEGYHALYLQLCDEFPGDDLVTQLRREAVLAAYWRVVQSLRYERDLMERNGTNAFCTYAIPNLHRYSVASQKAFAARLQELADMASSSAQPEEIATGESADDVADDSSDAVTRTEADDNQNHGTDARIASTDSTMVDSEIGSSTGSDSALVASAVEEVAPTTEPQNECLNQSVTAAPSQNSEASASAEWQITGEAESEDESGAAPVIQ